MSTDEIVALIKDMEKSTKAIKQEILSLCWHMRGGITYEDAMMLSYEERNIIGELIKDHMETTKKSGLPFF
jgi:hypothetical protein